MNDRPSWGNLDQHEEFHSSSWVSRPKLSLQISSVLNSLRFWFHVDLIQWPPMAPSRGKIQTVVCDSIGFLVSLPHPGSKTSLYRYNIGKVSLVIKRC